SHATLRGELMAILDLAAGRRRSPRPEVITNALACPRFEPIKSMALCSGSLRPLISSWCATRDGGEGNPRCDAERKRTLRLHGSLSLSDAADIDVAVVDQLGLLIGVGDRGGG